MLSQKSLSDEACGEASERMKIDNMNGKKHLISLQVAQMHKMNMFNYKKAPFCQIISGLRDNEGDTVLTVQFEAVNNQTNTGEDLKHHGFQEDRDLKFIKSAHSMTDFSFSNLKSAS